MVNRNPSSPTPANDTPVTDSIPAAPAPRRRTPRTRRVAAGDISPVLSTERIEQYTVSETTGGAIDAQRAALQDILSRSGDSAPTDIISTLKDILSGASPDEAAALRDLLTGKEAQETPKLPERADDELTNEWRDGGYPYRNLMLRKNYEKQKYQLQVELLKLQAWVKETGQRLVIIFEGRSAAVSC